MRKAESMSNAKHILIAVDDSEASYRAVTYVGSIIGGCEGFRVCLLHALSPLPRELLEFGGSEDPQQEERELCFPVKRVMFMPPRACHSVPLCPSAVCGGQARLSASAR